MTRRRRGAAFVAAAVVTQLVASVAALTLVAPPTAPEPPTTKDAAVRAAPAPDPYAEREQSVRDLLDRRAAAVLNRDKAAFMATVLPTDPAWTAQQAALFDALAEVPLASWEYELDTANVQAYNVDLDLKYGNGGWWSPRVQLRYAIAEFDTEPTYAPQQLTFVQYDDGWLIGGDADFEATGEPSTRGLWDFGPVVPVRGQHTLALGHPGSVDLMRQVVDVVDAAVPRVSSVWGPQWSQRVVVLVPETQDELDRMLNGSTDLSRIAAVATAELTDVDGAYHPVGNRVIVNPPNFAKLGRLGRQVVLTHETVHVASRDATGPDVPTWLVEGLADYIGYLEVPVPVTTAARELAAAVQAGDVPQALPTDADFHGSNPNLARSYEAGWLGFRLLVERYGLDAALRVYRHAGASRDVNADVALERALGAELGLTTADFTALWRDYLVATLS